MNSDKPQTVNVLLDVSNYFGESNSRMKPIIILLFLLCVPPFIYINVLYRIIPSEITLFWLFPITTWKIGFAIYLFYALRCFLIVVGEEGQRVESYKKRIMGNYSSIYSMVNIQSISEEGEIHYNDGMVAILLVAENGSYCNAVKRANEISGTLDNLSRNCKFDILIQNIPMTKELYKRYDSISKIADEQVAKDYVSMIDYYIEKTNRESSNLRIIYVLRGQIDEISAIRRVLGMELRNEALKTYKSFKVADKDLVEDVIARDVDTYIDFVELQMQKFSTGQYGGSEVIDYDVEDRMGDEEFLLPLTVNEVNITGFIKKKND